MKVTSTRVLGLLVSFLASAAVGSRAAQAAAAAAAIETHSFTHAGEGSVGKRRVFRNGCYQSESTGGTGGGGDARDSDVGCTVPSAFEKMFAQADGLIADGALVPEHPAPDGASKGRRGGLADREDAMQGARTVVVDTNGRRLVPREVEATKRLAAIVNSEPSLDQAYAKPPEPPLGAGPQLIALSAQKSARIGQRRLQASLVATGAWWCHRSVPARGDEGAGPDETFSEPAPRPLASTKATAILGSVLAGISARALAEADAKGDSKGDDDLTIEAAVGAGPRTWVRSKAAARGAAKRFGDEMRAQSTTCLLP